MIWHMAKQVSCKPTEYTPVDIIWATAVLCLLFMPDANIPGISWDTPVNNALVQQETTLVGLLSFWEFIFKVCQTHLRHLEHVFSQCMEIVALSPCLDDFLALQDNLRQAHLVFELKNKIFEDSVFDHMLHFLETTHKKTEGPDEARGLLYKRHELLLDLHGQRQNYHFEGRDEDNNDTKKQQRRAQNTPTAGARDAGSRHDVPQGGVSEVPDLPQMRILTLGGTRESDEPVLGEFRGWL